MRKILVALMALACLSGSAAAQQQQKFTADQGRAGTAPWPVTWGAGLSINADLRVGGNPVASANPVPSLAAQGTPGTQEWIVKDGADGPGTNPGAGSRGWLSGIYGRLTLDPSTGSKQDTGNASLASIATTSNGTSGSAAALNAATGAKTDAATASGADTSVIGALRAIRDRLLGTLNTTLATGSNVIGAVTQSGTWAVNSTLQAGSAVVGRFGIDQTTPGTTNGVVVNSSVLPTGAAQDATLTARLGTLGQKAMAASTPIAIASDQGPLPTTLRSAGTNRSASVGTTAVTLMAANTGRQGWKIKNDSAGDIWINFDAAATAAAGSGNIRIPSGAYLSSEPGFVETGAMSAIGSAAALAITAREY